MASRQDRELQLFALAIVGGVLVVAAGVTFAERAFVQALDVRDLQRRAATADRLAEEGTLYVMPAAAIPADPFAEDWSRVPEMTVPVTPQIITMPVLEEGTIQEIRVQAVTDGRLVAWRLSWSDPAPDWNVDTGRFADAVAVQFPLDPDASYMMGDRGKRVQILHWKAIWQKDVDVHFQDVQDLHPNYWSDLYWFAEGEFPYPVPEAFADRRSHLWFPAFRAGNPVSNIYRQEPVEELLAEGFGSLTHQPQSASRARGAWQDGRWAVVIARPMRTADDSDFQFGVGARGSFSVAVWEGGAANVGGRKHWSMWFDFLVGTPAVVS